MSTAEAPAARGTVSDLGETGLLAALAPLLPPSPAALVGVGDDCAVLAAPDGRYCVSTDVLVEGRHFRTGWMSAQQVGRRAAAQNLADVAAMGAVPVALVVGLVLPGDTPVSWVTDLARGLGRACAPLGVGVVGGDLSSGESIMVSVTVMGDLRGRPPVLRGGAHDGDLLVHVGNLGCGAAGLALLEAGYGDADLTGTAARCRELFRVPCPPLEAGPALALAGATAMMDVSDSLVRDADRLARASGVVAQIDEPDAPGALDADLALLEPVALLLAGQGGAVPGSPTGAVPGSRAGACVGARPLARTWVLTGGEDHGMLSTLPRSSLGHLPRGARAIGSVHAPRPGQAPGVLVAGRAPASMGWDHFH